MGMAFVFESSSKRGAARSRCAIPTKRLFVSKFVDSVEGVV